MLEGLQTFARGLADIAGRQLLYHRRALFIGVVEPVNDLVHMALTSYAIVVLIVLAHTHTRTSDLHIEVLLVHAWLLIT